MSLFLFVQAIEEVIVQIFYNVYVSGEDKPGALLKVSLSCECHVINVWLPWGCLGVEDMGGAGILV